MQKLDLEKTKSFKVRDKGKRQKQKFVELELDKRRLTFWRVRELT